jgi:hypothetical protein
MLDFVVRQWDFFELESPSKKVILSSDVPKNIQRRLSPLAKCVFNVAANLVENNQSLPIVFSTAHGESSKSLEMLKELANNGEISPTVFSLSVHNAISGLFSMAYANHGEMTVIAPVDEGIAPTFIEALGLLHEKNDEVLLVFYDEPLPDFYLSSTDNYDSPVTVALALKVALTGEGLPLRLSKKSAIKNSGDHAFQIRVFRDFMGGNENSLILGNHRQSWEWCKI